MSKNHYKIVDIGIKIHDALINFVESNPDCEFGEDLSCACAVGSWFFYCELKSKKIPAEFLAASNHAFVVVNDVIYDITATQFGETEKCFIFEPWEDATALHEELYYAYTTGDYGGIEFVNHQWPEYQKPINYSLLPVNNTYQVVKVQQRI